MLGSHERIVSFVAKVDAPGPPEQCVVTGSIEELGLWNPRSGLVLHWNGSAWVTKEPLLLAAGIYVEFKFVRLRYGYVDWEPGSNRTMHVPLSGKLVLEGGFATDSMLTVLESQPSLPASEQGRTERPEIRKHSDLRHFVAAAAPRYEDMASELAIQHKALEAKQQQQDMLLAQQARHMEMLRTELQEARLLSASLVSEAEQAKAVSDTGSARCCWETSTRANARQPREMSALSTNMSATGSCEATQNANLYQPLEVSAPSVKALKASAWQPLEANSPSAAASPVESTRLPTVEFQSDMGDEQLASTYEEDTKTVSVRSPPIPDNGATAECQAPPDVGAVPLPFFASPTLSFEAKASTAASTPTPSCVAKALTAKSISLCSIGCPNKAEASTAASTPLLSIGCPKTAEGQLLHGQRQLWNSRSGYPDRRQAVLRSPIQSLRSVRAADTNRKQAVPSSPMHSFRSVRLGYFQSPRTSSGRSPVFATPLSAASSSLRTGRLQNSANDAAACAGMGAESVRSQQCSRQTCDVQKTSNREATIAALEAARGASPVSPRTPGESCELAEQPLEAELEADWLRDSPGLVMSTEVEAAFSSAKLRFSEWTNDSMRRQISKQ
eukprot:TRINITY_DN29751_c0_g1_i2.p1 TRINITY_DN29751_c0_g1~~TRINITY_DN29751_c0_g1_i2.p1  ORF type:complete len:614 (-),score=98.73 TRINITY_DN29751_c0_g1_i2:488-2329(-)